MHAVVSDRTSRLQIAPAPLRRVLVIAPHFPPVNAPDHQRVRMAIPHIAENGWEAEVLAVAPEFVEAPLDPELAESLPKGTVVHWVRALPQRWTRRLGWGSLARRSYPFLKWRGDELLANGRFDLVFFSTSQFGVLPLARGWQERHGVPYVLDFHDEWVSGYYQRHPARLPPGGRLKYLLSRALARWQEGSVVRKAAQIVSVSERYNVNLRARYPDLDVARLHVLPFGGAESDFKVLETRPSSRTFFRRRSGMDWVYVGRGGPAMQFATRAFFFALRRALTAGIVDRKILRLHFIGTDYATGPRARPTFIPLARAFGLESIVLENTARVPHFAALQCLRDAHALIVPGSDDPGYSASKIFPYILARRPMLALFHHESSCLRVLRETGAGTAIPLHSGDDITAIGNQVYERWFAARAFERTPDWPPALFKPHGAREMTRHLTKIFNTACAAKKESA